MKIRVLLLFIFSILSVWGHAYTENNAPSALFSTPNKKGENYKKTYEETPCYSKDFSEITAGSVTNPSGTELNSIVGFNSVSKVYGAGGAIKFGTGSLNGYIISNPLTTVSGNITVKITAKGWAAAERTFKFELNSGHSETVVMSNYGTDEFITYTLTFVNVPANAIYTLTSTAKRMYLDDIKIICAPSCAVPSNPVGIVNVSNLCGNSVFTYTGNESDAYWQTTPTGNSTILPASATYSSNTARTMYVSRVVTGGCVSATNPQATSNPLPVGPTPFAIADQSLFVGNNATFTAPVVTGMNYVWEKSLNNGATWTELPSSTAAVTLSNLQLSDNHTLVRVTMSNSCGTESSQALLTVTTGPCYEETFNSLSSGNSTSTSGSSAAITSLPGFTYNNAFQAGGAVRIGSSSAFGSIESVDLTGVSGNLTVEISAKGWASGERTILVSVGASEQTLVLTNFIGADFETHNLTFLDVQPGQRIAVKTIGKTRAFVNNIKIFCAPACDMPTLGSTFPTSGPSGTLVTVNVSNASVLAYQVFFGDVQASVVNRSPSQLQFLVPANATANTFVLKGTSTCELTVPFTLIKSDFSTCTAAPTLTDLIISEVYDSPTGSAGYLELYNPTNASINLATYSLSRYGDYTDLTIATTRSLSGVIQPNSTFVIDIVPSGNGIPCTRTFDLTLSMNGINEDDRIELVKNAIVVDAVHTPNYKGYSIYRNSNAIGPTPVFNPSDWNTDSNYTCANLGTYVADGNVHSPYIINEPVYDPSCSITSANLAVEAGIVTNQPLTYQWYVNLPGTASWSALADGAAYTGTQTAVLHVVSTLGKHNYQYYCVVSQANLTCLIPTKAVQIKELYNTTWNGTTWSNGIPTQSILAVIDGAYNTATNGSFTCCSLVVNAGKSLALNPGTFVQVENNISNNGILTVENTAQLVQVNDNGVNVGNIILKRQTTAKRNDYIYWSAPVANFNVRNIVANTPVNYIFKWEPTVNSVYGDYGYWYNTAENMQTGKGYIAILPFSAPVAASTIEGVFTGVPNNGVVNYTVKRGNNTGADYINPLNNQYVTRFDDNSNLIGNPYPSAIDAIQFLSENPNLEGYINIWTHGTSPNASIQDPYYENYAINYTAEDYITFNASGAVNGPQSYAGFIPSGQAFFVNMIDGPAGTANIHFNNSMRSKTHNNSQFYKSSNTPESKRIWIDLVKNTGETFNIRTLVSYVPGATNQNERLFDAVKAKGFGTDFYSVLDGESYLIQGRQLPFDLQDQVPLGVNIHTAGTYQIAIGALENMENQTVYIEDKLLNQTVSISNQPYEFTSVSGRHENRFVLKFTNEILGQEDFNVSDKLKVFGKEVLQVQSNADQIVEVTVFDTTGKLIVRKRTTGQLVSLPEIHKANASLLILVKLGNNQTKTIKYIF